MIKYEIKKLLSLPHILLILLALAIRFALCFYPQNVSHSYSETVYKAYMEQLSGEYTADKKAFIESEYERMEKVISEHDEMIENYKNDIITLSEYEEYNGKYNETLAKISTVEYITEKCRYFDEIGGKCYFFYDTDWVDFLSENGIDYITAIIIILMIASVFSDEYSSRSRCMILTTYKGRTNTAVCKLCISFIFAFIISACMGAIRYAGFFLQSGTDYNMSVRNLIGYSGFSDMSLFKYYACGVLFHSVIWAVCSLFICMISNIAKSGIFTVFISFVMIVCAALLNTDRETFFGFIFSGRLLAVNLNDIFGSDRRSMNYAFFISVIAVKTTVYGFVCVYTWGRRNK